MSGCFTGIESTPAITYKDVAREKITVTPEEKFLADIHSEAPRTWQQGKQFVVTDKKIAVLFNNVPSLASDSVVGKYIEFRYAEESKNIYGEETTTLHFTAPDGIAIQYRMPMSYYDFLKKEYIDIPYAIDLSEVSTVDDRLRGETYFISTPRWLDANGMSTHDGLRHVPVTISAVLPGNQYYPLRVLFKQKDSVDVYSVFMTLGHGRTATRNFETLFSFDNPRHKHPDITDETWQLIMHSQVKEGMTREECRLALGPPTTSGVRPTTSGMVEYWSYADGIYLIFEEGLLSSFRR